MGRVKAHAVTSSQARALLHVPKRLLYIHVSAPLYLCTRAHFRSVTPGRPFYCCLLALKMGWGHRNFLQLKILKLQWDGVPTQQKYMYYTQKEMTETGGSWGALGACWMQLWCCNVKIWSPWCWLPMFWCFSIKNNTTSIGKTSEHRTALHAVTITFPSVHSDTYGPLNQP